MTTRLSLFDSPLFLGFDHFEETFNRMRKSADGYPPYNIEQTHENGLRISLAVAGFTMDDLDVEVEKNQLTIRGRQVDEEDGRVYLHRGIAGRQFQRSFVLADGIEVLDAALDNGLLHINMERQEPESTARKIDIKPQSKGTNGSLSTAKAIDVEKNDG